MYIFLIPVVYLIFYNNIFNNIFYFCLLFFLIYNMHIKNMLSLYDYGLFIEDRINIILENIMKLEYNLILLFFIVSLLFYCYGGFSKIYILLLFFVAFDLNFNYQVLYFFNLYEFKLNVKLLNGLFLIHPYCIYIFYSFIIIYCLLIFLFNLKYYFFLYNQKNFDYFIFGLRKLSLVIFF